MTSPAQPIRINHVTWGEDSLRQHQHPSPAPLPLPPPSLPAPQVPIAVIPMVPVVTATASVPPLPLVTPIAATATSLKIKSPPKDDSPPPQHQPIPHHLMCAAQVKAEPNVLTPQTGSSPIQSKPQIQIPYPTSIITTTATGSQHALLPQPTTPPQSRPNGMSIEDMRGMDMKRRPGG